MGLKVLLADDSSAIKKVVQLCLQDFGVELRSTGNGKDVLDLMKQFNPDLALIDVMLPHKPGFDVIVDIKKDAQLKSTPVIVLWSSFMDFDESKFNSCGAEGRLEKPFEAKDLRDIVKKFVPKAQTNPFLDMVDMPTAATMSSIHIQSHPKIEITQSRAPQPETPPVVSQPEPKVEVTPPAPPPESKTEAEAWSMSSFMDIGSFSKSLDKAAENDADWVRKDLGKFNIQAQEDEIPFAAPTDALNPQPASDTSAPSILTSSSSPAQSFATPSPEEIRRTVETQIQKLIEKEARAILEKAIWKIVPDMATDLIKEEIKRLTDAE
jgi:CheY-like chemotaxis protein